MSTEIVRVESDLNADWVKILEEHQSELSIHDRLRRQRRKGGVGSGYHRHTGRPGAVGGSSSMAGYIARVSAMKELGIAHASVINQLFKYGMPSTTQGGRRYVKWPEAKEWHDAYVAAGKGKAGVIAGNKKLGDKQQPPDLPKPPKPSYGVNQAEAMRRLNIKYRERLSSYVKHGMPTQRDAKGRMQIKWPEAQTWYDEYNRAGRGKNGIKAANKLLSSKGAEVPDAPPPPKPKPTGPVDISRGGLKSDPSNVKTEYSDGTKGLRAREEKNARYDLGLIPQAHLDTVVYLNFETFNEAAAKYGKAWAEKAGAYCEGRGKIVMLYDERASGLVARYPSHTVVHEAAHAVHNALKGMHRADIVASFGDEKARGKIRRRINKLYDEAMAGGKTVTNYAKTDVGEYFAESYSHYVKKSGKLRKADPDVYNFLRDNLFDGVEFVGGWE